MRLFFVFLFVFLLPNVVHSYQINGDSVVEDDSNIYLSVTPHTLNSDGYQTLVFKSKQFGGSVDVVFGYDSENARPTQMDYYNEGSWQSLTDKFSRKSYDYLGYDTWYVATGLNVNQNQEYTTRIWTDIKLNSVGKFFVCMKRSSDTISEAVSGGNYYCMDPWYNLSCFTRTNITYGSTGLHFSVNDNNTVLGTSIINTRNTSVNEPLFVYSNCSDGNIRIGNLSDEKAYENTSTPGVDGPGSNNPTGVFPSFVEWLGHFDGVINANDSTSNNNDGALDGVTSVTGKIGNALNFDADNTDFVTLGDAPEFDANLNDSFTFTAWFNTNQVDASNVILGKWDVTGDNKQYLWELRPTGDIRILISSDGSTNSFSKTVNYDLVPNRWYFSVVMYDGTQVCLSVNGSDYDCSAYSEGIHQDTEPLYIGQHDTTSPQGFFNGSIDEGIIESAGLSIQETRERYWNGINNLTELVEQREALELQIISPINGSFSNDPTLDVSFIATDNVGGETIQGQVWVVNGSGNFSVGTDLNIVGGATTIITTTPLAEETLQLFVDVNTTTGLDVNSSLITVTMDFTTPTINVDSPTNVTFQSSDIELNVSSDGTEESWWFQLNENGTNVSFVPNITFSAGADGAKNITVYVNDSAGNENSTTIFFTVDATAPLINIVQPQNITYLTTDVRFLANTTSADAESWLYWLEVDGSNITSNFTYTANDNVSLKSLLSIDRTYTIQVFLNDTNGNINHTNVVFTIDPDANITFEPETPGSGTDGGYSANISFGVDITAATTVGGYEPFNVRARLTVTDTSITFETPVIVFVSNNIVVGTWSMHYVSGGSNNVTYQRTVTMPPGVYTYFIETTGSNNVDYFSDEHNINVRVPANENVTNVTLPVGAFFGLLVTFTDETTPKSHSRVSQIDGIYISGTALNVNGSVENVTLLLLDDFGNTIISTTELESSNNGNNTWSLFGFSALPKNVTRINIQLGVIDSGGRTSYSVSRKLIVLTENEDGILKKSMFPFLNPFGDDGEGEGGISPGRVFASTLILVVLIGGLYASGAGTLPAVAFATMVSIEFATFGIIPTWISILGVLLIGMIMMRSALNMWTRR